MVVGDVVSILLESSPPCVSASAAIATAISTATTTPTNTTKKIQELLSRIEVLEQKRFSKWLFSCCVDNNSSSDDYAADDDATTKTVQIVVDESMRRARYAVESQATNCYSAIFKNVPSQYYDQSLDERAHHWLQQAPSKHYLCKSLLLENRKLSSTTTTTTTNPRFVLVILQYTSVLDMKKLNSTIRKLQSTMTTTTTNNNNNNNTKNGSTMTPQSRQNKSLDVPPPQQQQFDFRIATEEDNAMITGYEHNAVTPFGMKCHTSNTNSNNNSNNNNNNVPLILLSAAVLPLRFVWIGGGHSQVKLGISITDLCHALLPPMIIADISRPRTTERDIDDE